MAKLKLWVRNLIISLVLILSVAGVGVGLYFVFQPKQSGTDPDKPKELTPEQRQFISAVSQNEQVDVNPQDYAGLVLDDGEGEPVAIGVNNIVGKFGDYFVTNVAGDIAIYKQDSGSASLTNTTTSQAITLSKVAINTEYDKIYQGKDDQDGYYISGDYAILEKADHSLVIVSLITGNVVMEQSQFDASEFDEHNPVGSWRIGLEYFGYNFLITQKMVCTAYVSQDNYEMATRYFVYHLGDVSHPIEYNNAENQLLGYEITQDYAQLVSSQKTSVYSTQLGDNGRLALVLDDITNSCTKTTGTDAVATIGVTKYSKLEYSTVQFIPSTTFAIVARNYATTEAKVVPDENGNAVEKYDGVFYDDMLLSRVLVGANYRVLNLSNNSYVSGVKLSGQIEAKKSSIDGYIELIENQYLGYIDGEMQISAFAEQTARYFDVNFNEMVSYDYRVVGEVIYYSGDRYYTAGGNGGSEALDVWGNRTIDLAAWTMVSKSVVNSIGVVKHIADESSYELYNVATKQNVEGRYKFASQIMNGKVLVYKEAETEEDQSGFYIIDLATMTRSAIVGFDTGSFNLVSGSAGFYFTKGTDEKYTLHFTNGAEDIANIISYDFYGQENGDGIKVPQVIDGKVYVELTIEGEAQKRIVAGNVLGTFAELSSAEIEEKYPITITASNSTNLTRTRLLDKSVSSTSSWDNDNPQHGNGNLTFKGHGYSVVVDLSGTIPIYIFTWTNGNTETFEDYMADLGFSYGSGDKSLNTPVANIEVAFPVYSVSLKYGYIAFGDDSTGFGVYGDLPAKDFGKIDITKDDYSPQKSFLYNGSSFTLKVAAYKWTVTRKFSEVGVSGNAATDGTRVSGDSVVKYKVWSQDDYWRFQFINTEGYNWNGYSYDIEFDTSWWDMVHNGNDFHGDAFEEGGTWGSMRYWIAFVPHWEKAWVVKINSLSVGYRLPGCEYVGAIYVAPTTTAANPGLNNYTTSSVYSGEDLHKLHNIHTDVDFGFVRNKEYRGDDYVGTIRGSGSVNGGRAFAGFAVSSVGFTFAGLWQGDTQKVDNDGRTIDGNITGSLQPHQFAKHYTVTIHYADGNYSEDAKLPTTKEEINLYNDNNFTATKTFPIYYNQTINETDAGRTFASLWQPNASGTPGKDAEVCAPRGYSFDYLYLPNAEGGGNKELFLTQTSTAGRNTMSSTFGRYDGSSNYFADNKEARGEHAPGTKEVSINFYAIYTRRSYDWQIDLSDELPVGTPDSMKLHIFDANGTESVQDWDAAYVFQTGLLYHDGNNSSTAATNPIVPTMYVSDGETYYQVVVADKNISFGNNQNRQINNLYSGMSGYTDFATGEDHTDITLKATLKPMQYALKFTESIDDHVYVSGDDAINTTLGKVGLNVGASNLEEKTDYNTTEGHEWTSGGNNGKDIIVYDNFKVGYKIEIRYFYLNGDSSYTEAQFEFKRASAADADTHPHQENTIAGSAKIVFDVDPQSYTRVVDGKTFNYSDKLTITFYNYYGYYHVENGRGVFGNETQTGGLNANGIYSQIIVNAEVSTLPYDISVKGVPYSNEGRPGGIEKIGVVNNSVSEAYNGRYGNDNREKTEKLGYGSTAVVNIESGLYKHLHNRYYVPDSYVTSIGMKYNAETIFSLNLTGDAEREFSIAMGAATAENATYGIKKVMARQETDANVYMIDDTDTKIVSGIQQLNALLAVLYGRDGENAKLNYSMITEDSPLLYCIRKLSPGVYLITVKYVYNGTDLDVDKKNAFGVATAVMFNVDKPWVESNLEISPPTDHTYAISFVTASISHDLEVSEVGIEDAIGDNGSVKVEWNQNESFAGNYDVEPNNRESYQADLVNRMNNHTTTVDGKRVYDESFASDYLTFDVNAKKGYYVDEVTIVYNGTTYTITFEGLTINSTQDEIVFAYKINADVALNTENQVIVLDNLLFTIKNLAVPAGIAEGESTTLLRIVFGFVNQSSSIRVKYGTYSLLRFESVAESGAASEFAESNYIGYSYDNHGKLVVQKATGAIVNVTFGALQFIDEPSKARLYGLGKTTGDIYTAYDGKGIETRKTEALYFFVKDYSVKGSESKITIETTLNANASYQFGELAAAGGGYTTNLANLANSEHPDTEKTEKIATSTYNSAVNSKNVVSFAIAPKHIKTTIKSDIDFRGGSSAENKVFNETLNGNDKPLDANVLYYVNTAGDTAGAEHENRGQIASTNTTVQYREKNYEPDHQLTNGLYYVYGSDYGVFGEGLILTIKTVYGYEFTGFTFMAKFGETWYSKNFDWTTDKTEDGVTREICSVSNEGSSRKVGEYLFTREVAADGYVYKFNLQITNLASVEFDVKLHYAAKTFDVEYDTNASFGSSPVAEEKQTRTFVYNVKSDVNYGTAYLQTNINRAGDFAPLHPQGAPTSQNGGVNYTRVGYDQVGWAFGTSNFAKLPSDNQGRLQGQTSNIDNYNNGTTESEPGTLPTAVNYENYFYKVGRKDVTDAGYAWYYSLGTSYANVFGSNNLANAPKTTMYAIWNAKDYWMIFDYNDSINNHGSSLSSKIYATWVFDQTINVENEASADLKFDNPTDRTNKLSNVYRLGYTFDGWYFVEGTFNGTQHWNADYLIYANDYQNKPANFVTGQGTSTAKLEYAAYQKILEQTSWAEMQDEYDESRESYISRHILDGARTDANRSRVFLYAKWTANVYTFEYDLNAVSGNDNNYKSLAWNNGTLSKTTAAGMGSSAASLAESDKTIVEVVFDTKFSDIDDDWFKTYAYRYGYRFTGWYATRYAGTGDPGLLENSTLDKDLLVYLTNYTDKYESNTWGLNIASADEIAILQSKAAKTLSATNIVDSVDVDLATHVATNDSVNNKILLHARWTALEYTMNIDLNNEGHIDYAWEDADYAVAGKELGESKHFVNDNWIQFSVLFDQKFETGNLKFGTGITIQDIVIVSSKTEMYQIYDNGGYVNKGTDRYKVRFSQYRVAKETTEYLSGFETLTGIHTELLNYPGIIYSYGYNLGLNDGSSTYYFTLTRDTLGFEKKADIDAKSYPINGDTVFDEAYLLMSKFESTLDGNKYMPSEIAYDNQNEYPYLKTIDNSGSAEHHVGDMHKQSGALEAFGQRNLTLFAYWTQKDLKAQNNDLKYSTSEQYNNSLRNNNEQAIATQCAYAGNPTTKYDKTSATETTLTFFAPNGQYVSELYIDIYDDRLEFNPNDTKENRKAYVGRLTLYFTWDSVTRTVHIGKNNLIGKFNISNNFAGTSETQIYIQGNEVSDGLAENIAHSFEYNSLLHYLAQVLKIETSVYKTNQAGLDYWEALDAQGKNINTSYAIQSTPVEEGSNYDINIVTLTFTSLKSNFVVSAKNLAQTYQIDYYRYIRPVDGYSTKLDDNGIEYWDGTFYNDWDQYLAYQKLTYRYGEYASMNYGYASNFAFENWYYYQGHAYAGGTFEEYANYDHTGAEAYETHQSVVGYDHLLDEFGYWTEVVYTWIWNDESDHSLGGRYEREYTEGGETKIDVYGTTRIGDNDTLSLHQYHRYTQAEGKKFIDNGELVDWGQGYYNNLTYKFDRNPIRGNTSLICLYVPSAVHRVHYYSWDVSGGYVDRTASSREYILGEKKTVEVHGNVGSATVETWILGNNSEYYYVGFSGINKFNTVIDDTPTLEAAYAFLVQFMNCTKTPVADVEIINSNKISINWNALQAALDSGIVLNGKEYATEFGTNPERYAKELLKLLVQEYSVVVDNRVYGFNGTYLADAEVIKNMTFYDGTFKHDLDEIEAEIPAILWYEAPDEEEGFYYISNDHVDDATLPTDDTTKYLPSNYPGQTDEIRKENAYNAALAVVQRDYKKAVFNLVAKEILTTLLSPAPQIDEFPLFDGSEEDLERIAQLEQLTINIVDKLKIKDLNILLNSISSDYFGFVLKNPSSVVNVYPSGDSTYFAGWYLVDAELATYLDTHRDTVLTFNSDTWNLDSTAYRMLYVSDEEYHEEDGTRTYTLSEGPNKTGKTFIVSRFHTVDQLTHAIDKLSRVENEITVYAAFNCYRFEFKQSGTDFVMTTNELQWGSRRSDLNGDPYQYRIQDVTYYALSEEQYNDFAELVKDNNNLPTSLQTIINSDTIKQCHNTEIQEESVVVGYTFSINDNLNDLAYLKTGTWYIIACVYNVDHIEYENSDPEKKHAVPETDDRDNKIINMVSNKMIVVSEGSPSIATTGTIA